MALPFLLLQWHGLKDKSLMTVKNAVKVFGGIGRKENCADDNGFVTVYISKSVSLVRRLYDTQVLLC